MFGDGEGGGSGVERCFLGVLGKDLGDFKDLGGLKKKVKGLWIGG